MTRARALPAANPVLMFVLGVLFAGQLPGEPLHSRLFLALLVIGAVSAGVVIEATRKNGTIALLTRRVDGICGEISPAFGSLPPRMCALPFGHRGAHSDAAEFPMSWSITGAA